METTARVQTVLHFDYQLVQRLKEAARRERRSLNNYIENILYNVIEEQPNQETIQAINDAKNGIGMKAVDTSSLEAFMKSLDEE
ncbi:MAG: toxin-antitoxin system protein [Tannerella sp.]|jgi:hypothetical protein|nr:toxin-antitoxin system protein [Tannerella sp.]